MAARLFDWNFGGVPPRLDDLACMMALQWDPELRQCFEDPPAGRLSHDELTARWRQGYDRPGLAARDYRLSVLWLIATLVWQHANGIPPVIWWNKLQRALSPWPPRTSAARELLAEFEPRRAASIAAMSILPMVIIASNARLAAARSGSAIAAVRARGVICQDRPHRSLHQPHSLSWPPLPTTAFHRRSVSAWSSVAIWNEKASLCLNAGRRSARGRGCRRR